MAGTWTNPQKVAIGLTTGVWDADHYRAWARSHGIDTESDSYFHGGIFGSVMPAALGAAGGARAAAQGARTAAQGATGAAKAVTGIPDESLAVIRSIHKDGVIVQSGVKGPSVPRTFANDGHSGGQLLPAMDRNGQAITYRE